MIRGLLLLLLASPALADAPDLDPHNAEWNGLSRLASGLTAAGLRVETPPSLDLAALSPDRGLALFDPDAVEHPADLRRFVEDGGRLLLAVEGPGADPLLTELGLRLVEAPAAQARLGDHPGLLVLRGPDEGLLTGVRHVVTNHPAALQGPSELRPLLAFDDGTPFLYHLRMGAGELVVLADASPFINLMQDAGDDARLAADLGSWLGAGGQRPVVLAAAAAPLTGRYHGNGPSPADGTRDRLNQALEQLRVPMPDGLAVRFFVALLLAGTVIYALTVFPGGRPTDRNAGPPRPRSRAEGLAGRPGGPAAPDRPASTEESDAA
jgi:hypothetical protein